MQTELDRKKLIDLKACFGFTFTWVHMESSAVINCSFICHWESQSTQFAEFLKTKMKWASEQQNDSGTATQIVNVACYGIC